MCLWFGCFEVWDRNGFECSQGYTGRFGRASFGIWRTLSFRGNFEDTRTERRTWDHFLEMILGLLDL